MISAKKRNEDKAIFKLDLEFIRPIQKVRQPLETGLTFSFTLPPIPPSLSDLKIEKVKAQWGLDLEVWVKFFYFYFLVFFPQIFAKYFSFLLLVKFKHGKLLSHFHSLTIFPIYKSFHDLVERRFLKFKSKSVVKEKSCLHLQSCYVLSGDYSSNLFRQCIFVRM